MANTFRRGRNPYHQRSGPPKLTIVPDSRAQPARIGSIYQHRHFHQHRFGRSEALYSVDTKVRLGGVDASSIDSASVCDAGIARTARLDYGPGARHGRIIISFLCPYPLQRQRRFTDLGHIYSTDARRLCRDAQLHSFAQLYRLSFEQAILLQHGNLKQSRQQRGARRARFLIVTFGESV